MRKDHPNVKMQLNYGGLTDEAGKWNGKVRIVPDNLDLPLRVKKPTAWSIWNDLFHPDVDEKFIAKVLGIADLCRRHVYLILTKRPERMKELLADDDFHFHIGWFQAQAIREFGLPEPESVGPWPFGNCWLGVTAENQEQADKRIPILLSIPAALHWVNYGPALGPVDYSKWLAPACSLCNGIMSVDADPYPGGKPCPRCINDQGIDPVRIRWLAAEGESGPGARPSHPDWLRSAQHQCSTAGVPFLFKQWGEWAPMGLLAAKGKSIYLANNGSIISDDAYSAGDGAGLNPCRMVKVGKKAAGRLLDGREWNEYPDQVASTT